MARSERIDRQHVSLASEAENLYWEAKLGAVRDSITLALCEVGDDPAAIAQWLANHHLARQRLADPRPTAT